MKQVKHKGKISPSRSPILNKCAFFCGKKNTSYSAGRGTLIDEALRETIESGLDAGEIRARYVDDFVRPIVYGYNFVLNTMDYPTAAKSECRIESNDERIGSGEVDCIDVESGIIIDFKTGQIRDYYYQMLFYAYLAFNSCINAEIIKCYVCYLDKEYVENYSFKRTSIDNLINKYFEEFDAQIEPTPSQYCNWCTYKHTCIKRGELANDFMRHCSSMTRDSIAADKKILKRFLDAAPIYIDLYESVKCDAIQSLREGKRIDGYKLQRRNGKNGAIYVLKKTR